MVQKFNNYLNAQDYQNAANVASNTPELRNNDTLNKFLSLANTTGQKNIPLF